MMITLGSKTLTFCGSGVTTVVANLSKTEVMALMESGRGAQFQRRGSITYGA